MITEDNLFKLIKCSDEKAFEILFRIYYKPLVDFCCKFIHDEDIAKEITQQVFVNVWEKREKLLNQSPAPFLYQSVKNQCLNYLRHENVISKFRESEKYSDSSYEIEFEEANNKLIQIYQSIDKLPEQCKRVFIMSRMHGLSHKEIAEELNLAVKTIKNQIGKALKHLKEDLSYLNFGLLICILEILKKNL
ncbi:MAG: hypothetical protein A2W99_15235 [Bacteroidetes bacterium GWF2_33_16]|nr:MAG: hypothetical protein A2X00_09445 [Bacteroidetes bacterium GWE2_32_14]OFY07677.1 MAG: hypothetical protein A2W99_15235 [Bacteroidetes bacterium GWF2_33_16]